MIPCPHVLRMWKGIDLETRPCRIVLVEDNPEDVTLAKLALTQAGISYEMTVFEDGEKAIDLVSTQHAPPDLLLLDLNVPRRDGFEVLETVRSDPEWISTPVVVLSNSDDPTDMMRAGRLKANYIVKSINFENAVEDLRSMVLRLWYPQIQQL